MNKGVHINLEHWIQIISTIPEISSTDHSRNRTTDKRILSFRIWPYVKDVQTSGSEMGSSPLSIHIW